MTYEVPILNVGSYLTVFVIISLVFGIIRVLIYPPWKKGKPLISAAQPPQTVYPSPMPSLELIAAAVAGVHAYLREKTSAIQRRMMSQEEYKRVFAANYWIISERMNPFFKEDHFHREKSVW